MLTRLASDVNFTWTLQRRRFGVACVPGDETTVVRMHSGNGKHDEMDRRAIACFDQALVDVGLADDPALRQVLHDYFTWATTTTMARYHQSADDVPSGLSVPHWSWDGLHRT